MQVKVNVLSTKGFTKSDRQKIDQACALINTVVNSELFAQKFLRARMTELNGLTNEQALEQIRSGDCLFSDKDGTIDLKLVLYYKRWSRVVGYTNGTPMTIWINRKFFSTPVSIGSNLLHEACHLIGFSHYKSWETSLPYTMNRLFEACCRELGLKVPKLLMASVGCSLERVA